MNDGSIEVFANGKLLMTLNNASIFKSKLTYLLGSGGFGGSGTMTVSARPIITQGETYSDVLEFAIEDLNFGIKCKIFFLFRLSGVN